ncbi:hypothetical protein GBAR_LOCUS18818, partial [Geodia barretti]
MNWRLSLVHSCVFQVQKCFGQRGSCHHNELPATFQELWEGAGCSALVSTPRCAPAQCTEVSPVDSRSLGTASPALRYEHVYSPPLARPLALPPCAN